MSIPCHSPWLRFCIRSSRFRFTSSASAMISAVCCAGCAGGRIDRLDLFVAQFFGRSAPLRDSPWR